MLTLASKTNTLGAATINAHVEERGKILNLRSGDRSHDRSKELKHLNLTYLAKT